MTIVLKMIVLLSIFLLLRLPGLQSTFLIERKRSLERTRKNLLFEQRQLIQQFLQLQSFSSFSSLSFTSSDPTNSFSPYHTIHPPPYCKPDTLFCEKESNHQVLIPCEETLYMNEQLELCRDSFIKCTTSYSILQSKDNFKYATTAHNFLRQWKQPKIVEHGPDIPSPDKFPKIVIPPLRPPSKRPLPHVLKIPKPQVIDDGPEPSGATLSPEIANVGSKEPPSPSNTAGPSGNLKKTLPELSKQRKYQTLDYR